MVSKVENGACVNFNTINRIANALEVEPVVEYVEMLVDTSRFISSRLANGTLYMVDKEIIGNLNFSRDEKK